MKVMQIPWKMCWMLSILILILEERIRRTAKTNEKISFQPVPEDLIREIILSLDGCKATPVGGVPLDMLKSTVDIHLTFITKIINITFENPR